MRQTNLALVQPGKPGGPTASPVSAHPRPWRTFYYQPHSRIDEWSRIGRAASVHGAVRAALGHLLARSAVKAVVYDEDGLEVAHLIRQGGRVTIRGGF